MSSPATKDADLVGIIDRIRRPNTPLDDKKALFKRLYAYYAPRILPLLLAKLGRDCEDVQQNIWLIVWQKLPTHFRGDADGFEAWLRTIANNEANNHFRKAKRNPNSLDGDPPGPEPIYDDDDDELRKALADCLSRLVPRSRDIVNARLEGTLSIEEIAKRFKVEVNRLYVIISEAKAKLKDCVGRTMSWS